MKKLFTLLSVACALVCIVACSSSSSSPESVANQYAKCMQNGDVDGLIKLFYIEGEDQAELDKDISQFKQLMEQMIIPEIEKMGGVKSYTTGDVKMSDDGMSAKVQQMITYGDGNTNSQNVKVEKIDGKWYVDPSK